MDAISYAHSAKQEQRIKKFINDPDSTSGVVTVPKVIASGESVTIPAGRVAILPDVQVDGTLNVQGEVFIPAGATLSKVVELEGDQTISDVKTFIESPIVPTPTAGTQVANKEYVDTKVSKDGTGATGTWDINITGNAATATYASAFNTAVGGAPSYACRAWVNFNGIGTVAIRASGNVSSITDNGTGDYTVNFTTAMHDANYSVSGLSSADSTGYSDSGAVVFRIKPSVSPTTATVRLVNSGGGSSILDCIYGNVSIFR